MCTPARAPTRVHRGSWQRAGCQSAVCQAHHYVCVHSVRCKPTGNCHGLTGRKQEPRCAQQRVDSRAVLNNAAQQCAATCCSALQPLHAERARALASARSQRLRLRPELRVRAGLCARQQPLALAAAQCAQVVRARGARGRRAQRRHPRNLRRAAGATPSPHDSH